MTSVSLRRKSFSTEPRRGVPERMRVLLDHQGRRIRLSDERYAHILEHPEMASMRSSIRETLAHPERVVESVGDPGARLY